MMKSTYLNVDSSVYYIECKLRNKKQGRPGIEAKETKNLKLATINNWVTKYFFV